MRGRSRHATAGLALALLGLAGCTAPPQPNAAAAPPAVVPASAEGAGLVPQRRARMVPSLAIPLGSALTSSAAASDAAEPAPIPNRDIEPPRARVASGTDPRIEPLIVAPEPRQGVTFGREHLRDTGPDRPFDNLVPGARLRIPFE